MLFATLCSLSVIWFWKYTYNHYHKDEHCKICKWKLKKLVSFWAEIHLRWHSLQHLPGANAGAEYAGHVGSVQTNVSHWTVPFCKEEQTRKLLRRYSEENNSINIKPCVTYYIPSLMLLIEASCRTISNSWYCTKCKIITQQGRLSIYCWKHSGDMFSSFNICIDPDSILSFWVDANFPVFPTNTLYWIDINCRKQTYNA